MLAVSNRLILKTGMWFLAHAAFYAIGAYTVLLLTWKLGLNFWLAFPFAGLIAGTIAMGLGYATSRVKGVYFCIITVAFVEVVRLAIIKTPFFSRITNFWTAGSRGGVIPRTFYHREL